MISRYQDIIMACSSSPYACIRTWNASVYDSSNQKWIYGQLNLSANAVFFKSSEDYDLYIDFSVITSINKALSSFVFPAITIITKEKKTFWFSSFQSRNSTFLIIQHFYQALLHQKPLHSDHTASSPGIVHTKTNFGTDLLKSVYDSQATLQKAAMNLVEQGHQLRNAAFTMEELQEDLNVAERITSGLDTWLGRWSVPPTSKREDLILVVSNDIPDVLDLEVLCSQTNASKIGPQLLAVLRVAKEGITILDMKQKIVHNFKWSDISQIKVVSPWEIVVTRLLIGQLDLSYNLLSVGMPRVLRKLEMFAARKMEYMNPPEAHHEPHLKLSSDRVLNTPQQAIDHSGSNYAAASGDTSFVGSQIQQQEQLIADSEILELSAVLNDLKSLALDIQTEEDSQLQTIDNMADSVTRGTDRLKAINSKINKIGK